MFKLSHNNTPPKLRAINEKIATLLAAEDSDSFGQELSALIEQRDVIVTAYLKELTVDEAKSFAIKELEINGKLIDIINPLKCEARTDLQQMTHRQKVIKNYK